MTKFRDRYRVESARLPGWDYRAAGWYFVTVCTQDHIPFFGDVVDGDVALSPIGEIVAEEWVRTPEVRPNVVLDEWIVMPNHLHGIIVITDSPDTVGMPRPMVETPRRGVSTAMTTGGQLMAGSLGAIMGQIKSVCTKRIRAAGYPDFAWQSRFHDHIIRDEESLQRIRRYIVNNPGTWTEDRYYRT
jgi:REP element-mobilizing transposase RayT